ncbi:MAG: hypothetical protein PHI53_02670 [Candidatus Pacebacteria bacterium]|nr:hypothetical protein [Candidatus Paceibacterota bacterium]
MTAFAIFGQNCAGKDSILHEVQLIDPQIIVIRSTKVFMKAIGYPADPLSPETTPKEWYLHLESMPPEKIDEIADGYFQSYLAGFLREDIKAVATLHLVLLKQDNIGKTIVYKERIRLWYKKVFRGAIYVEVDANSAWKRRQKDMLNNSDVRNKGRFSKEDVSEESNQAWRTLVEKCFQGSTPCLVVNNGDSDLEKKVKIASVAHDIVRFINGIGNN